MPPTPTTAEPRPRMVAPVLPPFVERPGDRDRARHIATEAVARGLDDVYFVGCGGSLASSYPVCCLLEDRATGFAVHHLTSSEFVLRRLRRLGPRSLVAVATHTGTTPETLAAVDRARATGVPAIVGYTRDADSPLGRAVDEVFEYGPAKTAWDAKHVQLAHLGHALLDVTGAGLGRAEVEAAYDAVPEVLPGAIDEAEPLCAEIARELRDAPIVYVLGAGPLEATAYALSMCYLQEMQWMHSAAYNAGEFLHGAFEVATADVPYIVFVGEDETRPMAERALAFLRRYVRHVYVIDARDLSLPGIPAAMHAEIGVLALGAVSTRLAQHFEAARDHDLSTRRYMFTVEY